MVATTAASSGPAESWPSRSMPVSSRAETSYPSTSASLASVRATGVAPATSSRGATPTGSTKTSSPPPDGQVLTAATTPGSSTAAGSSATAACISAGVMRTSRGWPSASAASASLMTIGSEQAPPTQPDNRPSGVTTALSPTRADTGGSTRTTVARACAPLTATTVSSSRSHEALLVHGRPYLVAGHGHVDVGDAQRRQRVEHRVDVGRRRAHGGGLAHAVGAERVGHVRRVVIVDALQAGLHALRQVGVGGEGHVLDGLGAVGRAPDEEAPLLVLDVVLAGLQQVRRDLGGLGAQLAGDHRGRGAADRGRPGGV